MTIGEALKSIRLEKGLTQTEMAAGFTTESFYSKVERNVYKIDAELLLNILVANHVNIVDFFNRLVEQNTAANPYFDLQRQIRFAQNTKDLKKLDKIAFEIESSSNVPKFIKFELTEAYAWIIHSSKNISEQMKRQIRKQLSKCEWNQFSYLFLSQALILLDIDDAYKLVNSAFNAYEKNPEIDTFTLQSISCVCVNFLNCCYHHHAKHEYIERTLTVLNSLPADLSIGVAKIIGKYYWALFKNDKNSQSEIIKQLKSIGYFGIIADTVEEK